MKRRKFNSRDEILAAIEHVKTTHAARSKEAEECGLAADEAFRKSAIVENPCERGGAYRSWSREPQPRAQAHKTQQACAGKAGGAQAHAGRIRHRDYVVRDGACRRHAVTVMFA